ncbi:MAG: glycosyltransferase family 4 protein [Oscillospiraceae bacterium]|nr:glycosyltransferase family 4 protein [Oscillospiraceae bacterium]
MKTAWSGTPMGLYTALSKRLDVTLLDGCRSKNRAATVLNGLTRGLLRLRSTQQVLEDEPIPAGVPVFAFGEYRSRHIKNTYCYQDLSVDYLLRLRKQQHPAAPYALKKVIPTFLVERKNKKAKAFYEDCAGVFTMSRWLQQDLVENTGLPAGKVHHVGGGSNIDVTKIDCSQKEGNKFLFVGKLWDLKNGELVVEAFRRLCELHPDRKPQLYIAGPEEMPASVAGQENITFLGRLSYDQLIEYYNRCDYFVMPSRHDAYGLVFVEALCFGLPCIGKNLCAMPEFIQHGENGYLLEHDDARELTGLMEKLLLNGAEMARWVQEKRAYYLETYAWDTVADRIIRVLQKDGCLDANL